jgi:hypothetical protein
MTTKRPVLMALAIVSAASLVACSSSANGTPRPSTSPGGTVSVAGAVPSSAGGAAIDPCQVLSLAQVQPIVTPELASTKASTQPLIKENDLHLCTFLAADGNEVLTVSTYVADRAPSTFDEFRQSEDTPTDIAGVGDKAYRGDESPDVTAVHGDVLCTVDLSDPGDARGADRLYDENGHHTDIGAPAFDIVASALGTLCNRIFKSGNTTPDLSGLTPLHPPTPSD